MFEKMTDDVRLRRLERDAPHFPGTNTRTNGSNPLWLGLLVAMVVVTGGVLLSPNASFDPLLRTFDRVKPWNGDGSYAFLQSSGPDTPARYAPCRPIRVAVNPEGAPEDHEELVSTGLERIAHATGLTFTRVGTTSARDNAWNGFGTPPPVLILWADEDEIPELGGDTIGIGGSTAVPRNGELRYRTGLVALEREAYTVPDVLGPEERQAVMDHELAHLVGLDHVDDHGELMNARNIGATEFGPGDLAGLARLGPQEGECRATAGRVTTSTPGTGSR